MVIQNILGCKLTDEMKKGCNLLTDNKPIPIIIKNIAEKRVPLLGCYNKGLNGECIIYLKDNLPEELREAVFIHEILHGYLRNCIKEVKLQFLTNKSGFIQEGFYNTLRNRIGSVIDHPYIFEKMTDLFSLNIGAYWEDLYKTMMTAYSPPPEEELIQRKWQDTCAFISMVEINFYPELIKKKLFSVMKKNHLNAHELFLLKEKELNSIDFNNVEDYFYFIKNNLIELNSDTDMFKNFWKYLNCEIITF